ncbi:MAG: rhodanese-like domain-containing protein [Erysipelothrix sp.]|nr:rhodanese-like domain-containing protein [Erysipelothrix sp.]
MVNDIKTNVNIIDVREPAEIKATGSIKGSIKIPMNQIPSNLDKLNKDEEYNILCQSGNRSLQVAKYLHKQGYQVVNLMGGFGAFRGKIDYEL